MEAFSFVSTAEDGVGMFSLWTPQYQLSINCHLVLLRTIPL